MPPRYNNSDLEVLRLFSEAIRASDSEAYEVLFKAEYENVKYFIRHYVHDGAESEDLAQETFASLRTNRARIDPSRNIRSFLFTIASFRSESLQQVLTLLDITRSIKSKIKSPTKVELR